jgi:hypothetical protein
LHIVRELCGNCAGRNPLARQGWLLPVFPRPGGRFLLEHFLRRIEGEL